MSDVEEFIGGPSFPMAHSQGFTRLRRLGVPDPYDPDARVPGGWEDADRLAFRAVLVSVSSMEEPDPVRTQAVSTARLTIPDTQADIRRGDRIVPEPDDGRRWDVQGHPHADMNPFTGWSPTLVCELQEVEG